MECVNRASRTGNSLDEVRTRCYRQLILKPYFSKQYINRLFYTENSVLTLITKVKEGNDIDPKLVSRSIRAGVKNEKLMFTKVFYRLNIECSI